MATPASRTVALKPRARQQALLKERERAAYRPGILRTAALALVVIGLVSGLAVYAFFQRHEALTQRKAAEEQGRIPNVQRLRAEEQTRAAEKQARIAETQRLSAQTSEKRANDARDQADGLINFMLYDLRDKSLKNGRGRRRAGLRYDAKQIPTGGGLRGDSCSGGTPEAGKVNY
jgi:hypothetical protein